MYFLLILSLDKLLTNKKIQSNLNFRVSPLTREVTVTLILFRQLYTTRNDYDTNYNFTFVLRTGNIHSTSRHGVAKWETSTYNVNISQISKNCFKFYTKQVR